MPRERPTSFEQVTAIQTLMRSVAAPALALPTSSGASFSLSEYLDTASISVESTVGAVLKWTAGFLEKSLSYASLSSSLVEFFDSRNEDRGMLVRLDMLTGEGAKLRTLRFNGSPSWHAPKAECERLL